MDDLRSVVGSAVALGVAALIALFLTVTRSAGDPSPAARNRVIRIFALTLVLQCVHFTEELTQGLHERLPRLLGQPPMSLTLFVSFNLLWIAVWALSIVGLRKGVRAALFPAWFLGIGGALNGLAHPVLSLVDRGYFPGLWSSVPVGAAAVLLLRRLAAFTAPDPATPSIA